MTPFEHNLQRLLRESYQPEVPDPEFVAGLQERLQRTAEERAATLASERRLSWTRRCLGWSMAAAALIAVALLVRHARQAAPLPERAPLQKIDPEIMASRPGHLTPQPAAPPARTAALAVGATLRTGLGERKRVALPDGSVLFVNALTALRVEAPRRVVLQSGEVYVEVAPRPDERFVVQTPNREVTALGTRFTVRADEKKTAVAVTQGKVRVSGLDEVLYAGQQLAPDANHAVPAPRLSQLLEWTRDLMAEANSPLVPGNNYGGGKLIAVDPSGQAMKITLRRFHVDVHIEDGFARTTIDQTYFNEEAAQLEGTFYFPLPPDASIARLAMYVDGQLMEGGMAERDHARDTFEQIRYMRRDPALLEWLDGSTFKMRVFPLEARQEKRIVLGYTQRLSRQGDRTSYRFPSGHDLRVVNEWSAQVRVAGEAGISWSSPTHKLQDVREGSDLVLRAAERGATLDRDLQVDLQDRGAAATRFNLMIHDGYQYLMVRHRADLDGAAPRAAGEKGSHYVFLFETSADRDPLLARTQIEVLRTLLENLEHADTFHIVTAGTRTRLLTREPLAATTANIDRAIAALERVHLIGALDLEAALAAAAPLLEGAERPWLVHIGSGIAALGLRSDDELVQRIPEGVRYAGIGVGKRWGRAFMRAAAERRGGHYTQINPDEPVAWRAFDFASALRLPRWQNLSVTDDTGRTWLLADASVGAGDELCAMSRTAQNDPLPHEISIRGSMDGKPVEQKLKVEGVAGGAGYLPRTWARLEIERLVAADSAGNKSKVIELSKAMYVMSPFTSLLVLENEQMYRQYSIDRGRKDHWALYPCPEKIPVVREPLPIGAAVVSTTTRRPAEEVLRSIVLRNARYIWPQGSTGPKPCTAWDMMTNTQSGEGIGPNWKLALGEVPDDTEGIARDWGELPVRERSKLLADEATRWLQQREPGKSREPFRERTSIMTGDELGKTRSRPRGVAPRGPGDANGRVHGSVPTHLFYSNAFGANAFGGGNGIGGISGGSLPFNNTALGGGLGGIGGMGAGLGGLGGGGLGGGLGGFGMGGQLGMGVGQLGWNGTFQNWTGFNGINGWAYTPNGPLALQGQFGFAPFGYAQFGGYNPALHFYYWYEGTPLTDSLMAETELDRFGKARGKARRRPVPVPVSRVILHPATGQTVNWQMVLADLVAYAPGLETSSADIQATLEDEAKEYAVLQRGKVDAAARVLIERSRTSGWRTQTLPAERGQAAAAITYDGAGRFAVTRTLASGLRETITSDGETLLHLYPEIGLGARRMMSRAYRAEFAAMTPGALAPADDLAIGADVTAIDDHTVAIVPLGEGKKKATMRLNFNDQGRLVARRFIDGDGKEAHVERYDRAKTAPAPNLRPDTKSLLVLPLPYRTVAWAEARIKAQPAIAEPNNLLLAAHFTIPREVGNPSDVFQFAVERGLLSISHPGVLTLLRASGDTRVVGNVHDPVHPALSQYLAAMTQINEKPSRLNVRDGLLPTLARLHDLMYRWFYTFTSYPAPQRQDTWRETREFVQRHRQDGFGWVVTLLAGLDRGLTQDEWRSLAELWQLFDADAEHGYMARYERINCLVRGGLPASARMQFDDLYRQTLKDGVPLVNETIKSLPASEDGVSWEMLLVRTTGELAEQKRPADALVVVEQCHILGGAPLARQAYSRVAAHLGEFSGALRFAAAVLLARIGDRARAEELLGELLKDKDLAAQPIAWRLAADLAGQGGSVARKVAHLEKALDLEFAQLPETIDVLALRRDYDALLTGYGDWLDACRMADTDPPADLTPRVIKFADRWRALDPDPTTACQKAARVLRQLGQPDLAWEYLTTPLAAGVNQAEPLQKLAVELQNSGELDLAEKALGAAYAAEPTNAQFLWDQANVLLQMGRSDAARPLLRKLAEGNWQPRFSGLKSQAQSLLVR